MYYIKGAGMTRFGIDEKSSQDMVYEASLEALDGAGMTIKEIDSVVVSCTDTMGNGERQKIYGGILCSLFQKKMPATRVPAVCGGGGAALWAAIRQGYDNTLVIGVEKLVSNTTSVIADDILMAAERIYEQAEGSLFPVQNALVAQVYMKKYGATMNDLALVALKNHDNAFKNPKARFFGKKVTMNDIKKSPVVASPLRLFDCSLNVNGAAACIISKDRSDIEITASALCTDRLPAFESEDVTVWNATRISAKQAYKQAGIGPSDIDFAEVHDAFTSVELISYEDLYFCKKGDGKSLIRNGDTLIDGRLPVNTCGGLKAKGHPISATGIAQVYEIVKQMRKEAGDRQLSNVNTALAQNIGGAGSTVAVHIMKKVRG